MVARQISPAAELVLDGETYLGPEGFLKYRTNLLAQAQGRATGQCAGHRRSKCKSQVMRIQQHRSVTGMGQDSGSHAQCRVGAVAWV